MKQEEMTSDVKTIEQTVINVFETMMGLEVVPRSLDWQPMSDRVSATVQFSGTANGALILEMQPLLARKFAGCLLGIPAPMTVDDQVRDAIGEITNIIGGNLNTSIGQNAALSMPYVVDGTNYRIRICCNTEIVRQAFADGASEFWVSWIRNCGYDPCACGHGIPEGH